MREIGNFFARLSSRKFLLTLFTMVACTVYPELSTAFTTIAGIFIGAEGVADSVSRYSVEKTKQNNLQVEQDKELLAGDQEEDFTGVITPGTASTPTTSEVYGGDAPL